MSKEITIIAATGNKNKLREFKQIFSGCGIDATVLCAKDFEIEMPEETEETFAGNSMLKAETIYEGIKKDDKGLIKTEDYFVIADDSGLCVDCLGGKPGVYSARFSEGYKGMTASDERNIEKLLEELKEFKPEEKTAYFACAISVILKDGRKITEEGRFFGRILPEKRGENGFGYDPVFYVDKFGKTSAEMTAEEKNSVSHRGLALKRVSKVIEEIYK